MTDALRPHPAVTLYLDLLKQTLTNLVYAESEARVDENPRRRGEWIAMPRPADRVVRSEGRDLPPSAHTMIGLTRLDEIQTCIERILADRVPGDLLEAGVWRGGATIFMRGVLRAYDVTDRCVWVADSFAGFPEPDYERYPREQGRPEFRDPQLAVSRAQVERNFERYGLLDERVRFVEGFFEQSLPSAPIDQLALLRVDADLYGSTWVALETLYPKLSTGGFVIIDDYGYHEACRHAVEDFRATHHIDDELIRTDWTGVRWRKGG